MSFVKIRKIFAIAAILVLISLSIFSRLTVHSQTLKTWKPGQVGKDPISLWDHRLKRMKGLLPAHGVIGYINDSSVPGRKADGLDASGEYNLTRYALAPLILANDSKHDLVVGNFTISETPPPFEKMGFSVVKQIDSEIYLLKHQTK